MATVDATLATVERVANALQSTLAAIEDRSSHADRQPDPAPSLTEAQSAQRTAEQTLTQCRSEFTSASWASGEPSAELEPLLHRVRESAVALERTVKGMRREANNPVWRGVGVLMRTIQSVPKPASVPQIPENLVPQDLRPVVKAFVAAVGALKRRVQWTRLPKLPAGAASMYKRPGVFGDVWQWVLQGEPFVFVHGAQGMGKHTMLMQMLQLYKESKSSSVVRRHRDDVLTPRTRPLSLAAKYPDGAVFCSFSPGAAATAGPPALTGMDRAMSTSLVDLGFSQPILAQAMGADADAGTSAPLQREASRAIAESTETDAQESSRGGGAGPKAARIAGAAAPGRPLSGRPLSQTAVISAKHDGSNRVQFQISKLVELAVLLGADALSVPPRTLDAARQLLQRAAATGRRLVLVDGLSPADRPLFDALFTVFGDPQCLSACVATSTDGFGAAVPGVVGIQLSSVEYEPAWSHADQAILASYAYNSPHQEQIKQEHKAPADELLQMCGMHPLTLKVVGSTICMAQKHNTDAWAQAAEDYRLHLAAYHALCPSDTLGPAQPNTAQAPDVSADGAAHQKHEGGIELSAALSTPGTTAALTKEMRQLSSIEEGHIGPSALLRVFAAYDLAVGALPPKSRALLPVLLLFEPEIAVPIAAVEIAWSYYHPQDAHRFPIHLKAMEKLALVEVHDGPLGRSTESLTFHTLFGEFLRSRAAIDSSEDSPEVPSLTQTNRWRRILGLQMHVPQAWHAPEMRLLTALALVGGPEARARANSQLRRVTLPATAEICDWWRTSQLLRCSPAAAFRALVPDSGASGGPPDSGRAGGPIALRMIRLLLSGARQRVWPRLEAALPDLLRRSGTVLPAMAFVVGAMASGTTTRLGGWTAACARAMRDLAQSVGDTEASAALLNHVRYQLTSLSLHESALVLGERVLAIRTILSGHKAPETADALDQVGVTLNYLGRYEAALERQQHALSLRKAALGERHVDTAYSFASVSATQHALGRYDDALRSAERALDIRRALLGDLHGDTAAAFATVGTTLHNLGLYQDALVQQQRALEIRCSVLGEQSVDTAQTFDGVGAALTRLGRYEEALDHKLRALEIRRAVGGNHSLDVAESLHSVSVTLSYLDRHEEALALAEEAVAVRRKLQGGKSVDTARALDRVSVCMLNAGRSHDALDAAQRALDIRRVALGERHEDTARSFEGVAATMGRVGRYVEALEADRRALDIRRGVLGERHEDTARSLAGVGANLLSLGRYEEALDQLRQALDVRLSVLGEQHIDTADTLDSIGATLIHLNRHSEALDADNRALGIRLSLLGDQHLATAASLDSVGATLHALNKYDDALAHMQRALDVRRTLLGPHHADTLHSIDGIATTLHNLSRFDEALAHAQEALDARRVSLGEEDPATARSYDCVGVMMHNLNRLSEALAHKTAALDIRTTKLGEEDLETAQSLESVGVTLHHLKRYEEALDHKRRALEIRRAALGDGHLETASSLRSVALTLSTMDRGSEAAVQLHQSLEILEGELGARHPTVQAVQEELESSALRRSMSSRW